MPLDNPFIGSLLERVIATAIVIGLFSLLGFIYRHKIISRIKRLSAWVFNSEVHAHISRVEKFDETPSSGLDMDIFDLIKQEYPDIENAGLNNNTLRIRADGIPTVLEIRLEEEHEFGDIQPDVVGYKLVIETYSDLRFGYRTFESLEKFEDMSESITNIVQTNCFTGQHPSQSFVLTQLKEDIPSGVENIEDEELNISAQVQNSTMQMTFRSPQYLTKGIRKYFRPD